MQRSPTGTQKGRPLQLRPREKREPVTEEGRQGTRPREWHVPEPTGRSPASEQLARHAHRPWRRHQQSAQGEGGRPQASRGFLTPRNAQAAACCVDGGPKTFPVWHGWSAEGQVQGPHMLLEAGGDSISHLPAPSFPPGRAAAGSSLWP